jgi:uncharacterized protein YdeI (YjbR/CyaY-like superfamily)
MAAPKTSIEASIDPRVDRYISKARPFAQPILIHLRGLIHKACPGVHEAIKWSRPFFEYKGFILCNISAFNEHCSFGFWGEEIGAVLREAKVVQADGMGSLGRITTLKDLPSDKQMLAWLRQAKGFIDDGQYTSPISARQKVVKGVPTPPIEVPEAFSTALKAHMEAAKVFASFSPSNQREYTEWIAEAKRESTRQQRIETAIQWLAEGKQRHWKYQTS